MTHSTRTLPRWPVLLLPLLALSCGGRFLCKMPDSEEARPFRLLGHASTLRLDPATHEVVVTDSLRFSGTFTRFELNAGLELTGLEVGGRSVKLKRLVTKPSDDGGRRIYMLACRMPEAGLAVVQARGALWQDPANVRFGHETVGNELSATVGEEGAWFAPESAILPVTEDDSLVPHRLHADLPAHWSLVTDGRLTRDETRGGRHLMSWDEPLPGGPLSIAAGPYDIRREDVGGVEVSTWFFRRDPADGPFQGMSGPVDDTQVRDTLHRMSAYYLDMYRDLLGPYPYSKFAVVESFFPSGYGMPGWTLLGSQVIRMPYIPYTSLGHELLHNYWGNGVYVDASRGNWCEGITVYDADYRYKRLESEEAGREYRKGILKDYRSYVDGSRDLPLRDFVNRHDGATRAIGYGKSMMVFHMLEQMLGREAFDQVRRGFYQAWTGRAASWDDLLAACEAAGQLDLSAFAAQWLDRTGAPALELGEVDYENGRLSGVLRQTQTPPYQLEVPVRVEAHDGTVLRTRVLLDGPEVRLDIACPPPRKIQVDPGYDVFRLLDGREMEPVVSLVLGEPDPLFAAPRAWLADPERRSALDGFARALREVETPEWVACEDFQPGMLASRSVIVVNAPALPAGLEFLDLRLSDSRWEIAGQAGERAERSLVLAGKSAANDRKGALLFFVPGPEALPALARKVPHYGKYSYLAFDAAGVNVAKGNLSPTGSPLERRFGGW
jgi:aminopeptidase N